MNYKTLLAIFFLLTFLVQNTQASHNPLEDFGYNSSRPITGPLPLLTILVEYADVNFRLTHTPDFYRELLFSNRLIGRVAGLGSFFDENSGGQFFFENAGILGPFQYPDIPATAYTETVFNCAFGMVGQPFGDPSTSSFTAARCGEWRWDSVTAQWENFSLEKLLGTAVDLAAATGFPFSSYDDNVDGIITVDELVILVIGAGPNGEINAGGSRRGTVPDQVPVWGGVPVPIWGGLVVDSSLPNAAEDVGAATLMHELSHTLLGIVGGNYEGYGAAGARGFCLNPKFTTMSCTIARGIDDRQTFHLDPFTKMKMGWLRPTIVHAGDSECVRLDSIDRRIPEVEQSYLIYDETRGTNEFFLIEFRDPKLLNYDGDPWFTGRLGVPDRGLGIWYVQIDESGWPFNIDALDGTLQADGTPGRDTTLFLIPPGKDTNPATWGQIPSSFDGLWDAVSGLATPTWLDGTASGVRIGVVAELPRPGGWKQLWVRLGPGTPCLGEIPPIFAPVSYLRTGEGVDQWTHKDFVLERTVPAILSDKDFEVKWSLTPKSEQLVRIQVTDQFPEDFIPLSQGGTTVTFDELAGVGQTVTLSYPIRAGHQGGGMIVGTHLSVEASDSNPRVFELESFLSVLAPVEATHIDEPQFFWNDADGDGVLDGTDQCPDDNAASNDVDGDGCTDSLEGLIQYVGSFVDSGDIFSELNKPLTSKLENAEKHVQQEEYCTAINQIGAFNHQIDAQVGKGILDNAADTLLKYSKGVIGDYRIRFLQWQNCPDS